MTDNDTLKLPAIGTLHVVLRLLAGGLLGLFGIGMSVGILASAQQHSNFSLKVAGLLLLPILLEVAAWWIIKPALKPVRLPKTPRMRQAQVALYGSFALAIPLAILLQIGQAGSQSGPLAVFSYDAKISPSIALGILLCLTVGGWLSVKWLRNIDEHERAAHDFGAVLSTYFYFSLCVGWWAAWRGGFVSEPSVFAIFWATMLVWTIGWLYRRFN